MIESALRKVSNANTALSLINPPTAGNLLALLIPETDQKTKRIQNALATLGTVELRVVELGAISRPVRIIGDEFDRAEGYVPPTK